MKIIIYPDNSVNFRDDENVWIKPTMTAEEVFSTTGISKERLAPFDKTLDDTFHWIDGDLEIIALFTGLQGANYERSNQRERSYSRKIKTVSRRMYEKKYKGMSVHEKRVAMVNGVMDELGMELVQ